MTTRAVFFDLDGLLVNTEPLHVEAYHAVADHLGISLDREYLHSLLGAPTRENLRRIMDDNDVPPGRFDDLLNIRYDAYLDTIRETTLHLEAGALSCLTMCRERGYDTALVTSSIREHATAVLDNVSRTSFNGTGVQEFFTAMVFGDDVPRCKPAPDLYLEAIARLRIDPGEGIALEDSEAGVMAAKAAGLHVIAVPCAETGAQDLSGADLIASSLTDVCSLKNFR